MNVFQFLITFGVESKEGGGPSYWSEPMDATLC